MMLCLENHVCMGVLYEPFGRDWMIRACGHDYIIPCWMHCYVWHINMWKRLHHSMLACLHTIVTEHAHDSTPSFAKILCGSQVPAVFESASGTVDPVVAIIMAASGSAGPAGGAEDRQQARQRKAGAGERRKAGVLTAGPPSRHLHPSAT